MRATRWRVTASHCIAVEIHDEPEPGARREPRACCVLLPGVAGPMQAWDRGGFEWNEKEDVEGFAQAWRLANEDLFTRDASGRLKVTVWTPVAREVWDFDTEQVEK